MKGDVGVEASGEVIPPPLLLCIGVGNGCATTGSEANVGEGTVGVPPPLLDALGKPAGPAGDTGNVDIPAPRFTNCGVAGAGVAGTVAGVVGVVGVVVTPLAPPIKLILSNLVVH